MRIVSSYPVNVFHSWCSAFARPIPIQSSFCRFIMFLLDLRIVVSPHQAVDIVIPPSQAVSSKDRRIIVSPHQAVDIVIPPSQAVSSKDRRIIVSPHQAVDIVIPPSQAVSSKDRRIIVSPPQAVSS
eukprot:TRINITY_DN13688_c0_g1_i14.p1 TRINITY_DN13688_c0_g1~~TRINITY_DN13688_c0_g1_i14.p1  ORF type:complete len:127 (+),score=6.17 TRINITY_DN13688_c0_g1_i14:415-795(+)